MSRFGGCESAIKLGGVFWLFCDLSKGGRKEKTMESDLNNRAGGRRRLPKQKDTHQRVESAHRRTAKSKQVFKWSSPRCVQV